MSNPAQDGADYVALGRLAFAEDDFAATRDHWQSCFSQQRSSGNARGAARVAADLALLYAGVFGNEALAAGWLARAQRLLATIGRCVEQGYVALACAYTHRFDLAAVEKDAAVVLELAIEFSDSDLEVVALTEGGYALIAQGRLTEGFSRLDEAIAAMAAGEGSDGIVGMCLCVMLAACQRAGDLRRAEQWTNVLLERLAPGGGMPRIVRTECRVAYGALLRSVGRWNEAEVALVDALTPTSSHSAVLRFTAAAELADLRIVQGRLEEAAALLRPHEDRVEVCGVLARLHLAHGEPALAAAAINRALRQLVADRLREGELLALLVESELAQGDLAAAGIAAERLAGVAAEVEGPGLRAEADLARARVAAARGAHAAAIALLEQALQLLAAGEPPLLCGLVHLELAWSLANSDAPVANAIIEARAAMAIFERLGARAYVDRTAALLRQLGDSERPRGLASATTATPLTAREADVLNLVRRGLTNAQIGERLYISPKTAEHHVSSVLAKLGVRRRAEAAALSIMAGI